MSAVRLNKMLQNSGDYEHEPDALAVARGTSARLSPAILRVGVLALLLTFAGAGCALYENDRCYVSDPQYADARAFFVQSGSLELVRQRMEENQWRRCRINEVLYRLQKEFEVLPEEVPEPSGSPAPPPASR